MGRNSRSARIRETEGSHTPNGRLRRRFWFGPGTLLAVVIAAAALAVQGADRSRYTGPGRGNISAMAGSLREPARPGVTSQPPAKPLWKPEVGLLLEREDLRLTQ